MVLLKNETAGEVFCKLKNMAKNAYSCIPKRETTLSIFLFIYIYIFQGLTFGITLMITLKLRNNGADYQEIATFSLCAIPFTTKME